MTTGVKIKRRGFVMTGGGAKGLYEAGVIHAFHLAGMEFDVITGSSIGAMNSIFYAEYQFQKKRLAEADRQDPLRAIDAMNDLALAYHHAWLLMPDKKIIDDSEDGPLGQLKDDLQGLDVDLPTAVRLAWWWSDPQRGKLPPVAAWPALLKLARELIEHLGGAGQLLRIIKEQRDAPFVEAARVYLARFGLSHSLAPAGDDHKLEDVFTQPVSPLRPEHLSGDIDDSGDLALKRLQLIDPQRTLSEYAGQGIAVRLTRANYRTGRLEISAYISPADFLRFLEKQVWRLRVFGPDQVPLGSFRLQVPGDPNAIHAALCSGRYPGVFAPFPLEAVYPSADPKNELLYRLLGAWLDDPGVADQLGRAYDDIRQQAPEKAAEQAPGSDEQDFASLLDAWRKAADMRDYFPRRGDVYVDGGAIDNTPSNSAIDYLREWVDRDGQSRRSVVLDLYVIYLGKEPKVDMSSMKDPSLVDVVKRALDIQGAAVGSSDANTVSTINAFGQRSDDLARALKTVLAGYQESLASLPLDQQNLARQRLAAELRAAGFHWVGPDSADVLERAADWMTGMEKRLPLHVEEVKIYPQAMPLDTLQFTERLGYRQDTAIQMLTLGCADTLWALRDHLEDPSHCMDDSDQQTLRLVKLWTGLEVLPQGLQEKEKLRKAWRCQRQACIYHAQHCQHGAQQLT